MQRIITVETSQFSENPTTRWQYGTEIYVEDIIVEYPKSLDYLSDDDLLELADNEEKGCKYIKEK
jgi:hypothetical protein